MRLATFNCNSVRSRLNIILDWLEQHQPDVLALQETKVQDKDFPLAAFNQLGWQISFCGQKSYNGVAMVTRDKPDEVRFGLEDGDGGESGPRLAYIKLGELHVVNTYIPQGQSMESEKFTFKLKWFSRLQQYFTKNFDPRSSRLIWTGDLNVAPTPIDVHDHKQIWPHVCHCQEVIDAFKNITDWGFVDIFRKHLPEAETYTFWDYRMRNALEQNRGWRIDHILATRCLADSSANCAVDTGPRTLEKPSDHTFVYADFGG